MNTLNLAFNPELPIWLITTITLLTGGLVLWGVLHQVRGAWIRATAWAVISLALFNPSILSQQREQLKSIVAIIVDKSASQGLDGRDLQTKNIQEKLVAKISAMPNFETRILTVRDEISTTSDASTAMFKGLKSALQDVPPDQVAGAIFITDGQVHDIPKSAKQLGLNAPVHALITGRENERDRRIVITNAPRFGAVGSNVTISFKVEQSGIENNRALEVIVLIDGEEFTREFVPPNEINELDIDVPHGGKTIIELRVEEASDEISTVNNHAYTTLNGIRENLRVLLVSGEPHAGERTWRNLLKSDASVDLVHFTILRPPDKQDGTPINQLSLIAFPTRELFIEKIDEFDLIIFDRYSRRGVLPTLYFDNIARYVEDGGAVLVAAGPEFAIRGSIAQTPLQRIIPALPNGTIAEVGFLPKISELGEKHPVTRGLSENTISNSTKMNWSPWFRTIGSSEINGDTVMTGNDDQPLLILKRAGEGRIALFLSDHVWLWARGFQGGGPHVKLLRRLAHWLMQEPELSEEYLSAQTRGETIHISRQSLSDEVENLTLTTPTGEIKTLPLVKTRPGIFEATFVAGKLGLYQVEHGDLRALTHVGPANPREFAQVLSTTQLLKPVLEETGGNVLRVENNITPRIIPVGVNSTTAGKGWIGLRNTNASLLKGVNTFPLFSGLLGLAILMLLVAGMWAREGR